MSALSPLVATYLTTFNPPIASPSNRWEAVKATLPFSETQSTAGTTQQSLEQAFGATVDAATGYTTITNLVNGTNFVNVRIGVSYENYFNNQPLGIALFTAPPENNVYDLSTLLSSSSFNYANSGGNIVVLNDTVQLQGNQSIFVCLGDYGPGWGIAKIAVSFIGGVGGIPQQNIAA